MSSWRTHLILVSLLVQRGAWRVEDGVDCARRGAGIYGYVAELKRRPISRVQCAMCMYGWRAGDDAACAGDPPHDHDALLDQIQHPDG